MMDKMNPTISFKMLDTTRWHVLTFEPRPSVPYRTYGHSCVEYKDHIYMWGGMQRQACYKWQLYSI